MFLKSLKILTPTKVIRQIDFHMGLNLIVDESEGQITGNNVGKTTVLKLIDFCFGADKKIIYEDPEDKKQFYKLVKDYLVNNEVIISLEISENLYNENAKTYVIERNFLFRKRKILSIDGRKYTEDEFENRLVELFFPNHKSSKPTFKQIISHNIRYKDTSLNNTLKTLNEYTALEEYETLYLFLLGCNFTKGDDKQAILQKIKLETTFKNRLEKVQTKSAYEVALSIIDREIEKLQLKKANLNINDHFEKDLQKLNQVKYQLNSLSSQLSNLNLRKNLILKMQEELQSSASDIDFQQLRAIYNQVKVNLTDMQKSFEDMVQYHNQMIQEKANFISKELPVLSKEIENKGKVLNELLEKEVEYSKVISKSDSFETLEKIITELNEKFKNKGEYENTIHQIEEVENNLKAYNEELRLIDTELFSDEFEAKVKLQLNKFNRHFSYTSDLLYGEQYALKYDIETNKKGQKLYKFSAFNTNFSSGKKQGEISCFDIAYTLFADSENIPCMHFILNDKKELMHGNQLVKISELVNKEKIQFIASILKDKLPNDLNDEKYFTLKLSQKDKLFKIEENKNPWLPF
ncbi:MAG: DUF2326 domain-containing protein [Calditrichaeota bacterium]|nr:MAG: DUF2326 domain-containing protein [Calditrichota bacterium]